MDLFEFLGEETGDGPEFTGEMISEEELARWSTDESFNESQRFNYLLDSGFPKQKASVINRLPEIIRGHDQGKKIFPKILDLANTWTEELLSELALGLVSLAEQNLIANEYKTTLINMTIKMLNGSKSNWPEFFKAFLSQITKEDTIEQFLPCIYSMCSYSRAPTIRKTAASVVGALAKKIGPSFSGDELERALNLTADSEASTRFEIATQLYKISKHCGQATAQNIVFPYFVKLLDDEDIENQQEAITGLSKSIQLYTTDFIADSVVTVVQSKILEFTDLSLIQCTASHIGKLFFYLKDCLDLGGLRKSLLEFYLRITRSHAEEIRASAAYHFPAVFTSLGEFAPLEETYQHMMQSGVEDVIKPLACSFAELVRFVADPATLKNYACTFLQDDLAKWIVASQLDTVLTWFNDKELSCELIPLLLPLLERHPNIRQSVALLKQISQEFGKFKIQDINGRIFESLVELSKNGCSSLQTQAANTLAIIVHNCYIIEKKTELVETIIQNFAAGSSYRHRLFYIEFCAKIQDIASERGFVGRYLNALLAMHTDTVDWVKYRFVKAVELTRKRMSPDADSAPFLAALDAVIASSREDLVQLAQEASSALRSEARSELYSACEDARKEKEEEALKVREVNEKEEAKRKHIDALTQKARKDYLKSETSKKKLIGQKKPVARAGPPKLGMVKSTGVKDTGLPKLNKNASTPLRPGAHRK